MNVQSSSTHIEWTGDLADDCTAIWAGLMLGAEEMDRDTWWWAVSQDEGRGDEIRSSNFDERECCSARSRGSERKTALELFSTSNLRITKENKTSILTPDPL